MVKILLLSSLFFVNLLNAKEISLSCVITPVKNPKDYNPNKYTEELTIDTVTNDITLSTVGNKKIFKGNAIFSSNFIRVNILNREIDETIHLELNRKELFLNVLFSYSYDWTNETSSSKWTGQCTIVDTSNNKI